MTKQEPPNLRSADTCANCYYAWHGWEYADVICTKYNHIMDEDEVQICDDYVREDEE